ncbi:MAG: spermidine/putrescine ABC transporter substrate-binding protein [Desulfobacterales bacterium]|nr:spermidine/putrescine ABC transporter substrate-binding protein [Desulfobacterales bacterium]
MKIRQNWIGIILAFTLIFLTGPADMARAERTISFLNWSEFIDPDLIPEFEAEFGIKVKEVFFETDEEREQKLAYTQGKGYDVILMSGPYIESHEKRKWITPLDMAAIPNIVHVDPRWRSAYPKAEIYAVPYLCGSIGIIYRRDLVPVEIDSWQQFFRPDPGIKGKICMINDSKEVIGMALKALGHSVNSGKTAELAEAENLLMGQRPFVSIYATPDITETSPMVTGEMCMSMTYNGDALAVQEFSPEIRFVLPKEGGGLWVDYLTVAASSEDKAGAMAFINFLNRPKNAARLAAFTYFASPNKAAEAHLSKEHLENPVIYPPKNVLDRSEFFQKLSPRVQGKRNQIFSRVTQ